MPVFVGYDTSPSNVLGEAYRAMREPAKQEKFLLAGDTTFQPSRQHLREKIAQHGAVIVGTSSPGRNAHVEIMALELGIELGLKLVVVEDTFFSALRIKDKELRLKVDLICVISLIEVGEIKDAFPNARVVVVGNPMWDSYFKPAHRQTARNFIDASDNHFVVGVFGTKTTGINMALAVPTLIGLRDTILPDKLEPFFVFGPHPGENDPKRGAIAVHPDVYRQLAFLVGDMKFVVLPPEVKADTVIPGLNAVVDYGNSSAGIHAIARRIPLLSMMVPGAREFLLQEIGRKQSITTAASASLEITSGTPQELSGALQAFARWKHETNTRLAQEKFLAPRTEGESARLIAEAIESLES